MHLFSLSAIFLASLGLVYSGAPSFSSSYRKDQYLPQYGEFNVPLPLEGGRVHVVGLATGTGVPTTIMLNGSALDLGTGIPLGDWLVDWARAEPLNGFVSGSPFWFSFHSRRPAWDALAASGGEVSLAILDPSGAALASGTFGVKVPEVPITYVTTAGGASTLHIFVRAQSTRADATLATLRVNGADVTSSVPVALRTVPANETLLWALPASALGGSAALAPGQVWTVEADWATGSIPRSAAGGILFREFYPIETWEHSSDCPFPTINDTAYDLHRSHGIDTFFTEYTLDSACNTSITAADLVNTLAPLYDFYVLPSAEDTHLLAAITNTSRLAGLFLADEDDTVVDDKARKLLGAVVKARTAFPGIPTYGGGASNRYTGAYSGITDIKGMDAYIGACAPHYILLAPPPRYSYDYLANTRANHAPGATWLYSQGFEEGWDGLGHSVNRQASAGEIAVQVASVGAAGAKGLMLFETQLKYLQGETAPAWDTLGTLLREVGALRELLRSGEPTGAAFALGGSGGEPLDTTHTMILEATLSARALVVHAINIATAGDPGCLAICALGLPCHFTFVPTTLGALGLTLPLGFTHLDSFEVFNASVLPGTLPFSPPPSGGHGGRGMVWQGFALGDLAPGSFPPPTHAASPSQALVRTLVLASDTELRGEIAAALEKGQKSQHQQQLSPLPLTTATPVAAAAAAAVSTFSPLNASLWRTARNSTDRMTPQAPVPWSPTPPSAPPPPGVNATRVTIDASSRFQTILGFGGAITESSVSVFNKLDAASQAALLADLYGENGDGTSLRYSTGRLTIGSCDFSLGYYNYNAMANDTAMTNFTIAHDEVAIIPFILAAQNATAAAGRPLRFLSTPWSPPAWMKTNKQMSCFPLGPLDCALIPEYQPAYALYLSKYLTAYAAAGVDVWGITVQNEPQPQTGTLTYEGMWFPLTAELEFVAEYLGPQLAADHPDTKIFIFDHNQADAFWYAAPLLADPIASKFVDGVAFHWYSGPDWSPLDELTAAFPNALLLASEATVGREETNDFFKPSSMVWDHGEYYGTFILQDLVHNSIGFIDWNILLDNKGGPDHGDPTGELCEGLIPCGSDAMLIADLTVSPPVVYKQAFYWYMGHVSRFVPPGSVRVGGMLERVGGGGGGNNTTPILGAAFETPQGDTVLVLQNGQDSGEMVEVVDPRVGYLGWMELPPHSIVTLSWSAAAAAGGSQK